MEIPGHEPIAMVDVHDVPGEKKLGNERHDSAVCRVDRLAERAAIVDAQMAARHASVEHTPAAEHARDARGPRPEKGQRPELRRLLRLMSHAAGELVLVFDARLRQRIHRSRELRIDLETARARRSPARLNGGRRPVRIPQQQVERVDSARLPLDGHARDDGVGRLHRNGGNRLKTTSGGWTKVHWLSSHDSRDTYRRVCVPRQPIDRQSNEGSARRLPRLDRESRLGGRDAERNEHSDERNYPYRSLRSPLVVRSTFVRSHSRKIHSEFAALGNPPPRFGYQRTMDVVRRISLLVTAGLLGIAVMLGGLMSRPAVSANVAKELNAATSFFDSTIVLARGAQPQGPRGDQLTIELGYLERLRLGLGSPFRLVDEALADPRLSATMENRVAWALLGRLRRGDAYVIDPVVARRHRSVDVGRIGATGSDHLALIERAVRGGVGSARRGAGGSTGVSPSRRRKGASLRPASSAATDVAALVRDRASALADVRDLLGDATAQHADAARSCSRRAALERVFRVEQPALAPLPAELQIEAMNAVPAILRAIDTLDSVAAST